MSRSKFRRRMPRYGSCGQKVMFESDHVNRDTMFWACTNLPVDTAPEAPCLVDNFSSRSCERGTRSCMISHGDTNPETCCDCDRALDDDMTCVNPDCCEYGGES